MSEHAKKPRTPVPVVVADDHPLVRVGVRENLEAQGEFIVVGEACTAYEVVEVVRTHRPRLLIMDLEMPGPTPDANIGKCRELVPGLKVLILSGHSAADQLSPLRDCRLNGFVLKEEGPDRLLQAVRVVCAGQTWLSHGVRQILAELAQSERLDSIVSLTPREQQIFELMQRAFSNQAIARELHLSKQTVRRYATTIYEKLGVKNRIQAIVGSACN